MDESSMEGLAEVFKCFICLGKLKDAHLCPHCSKPCCYACIRKWLLSANRSECPHCRKLLRVGTLVNCRWVDEVTQKLDTLQQNKENAEKGLCTTHNEKLSVFCMNCKECICHQCALWGENHCNHVFRQLEDVCHQIRKTLDKEFIYLRKRHTDITNIIRRMKKSTTDLVQAKIKRVDEVKNFMAQMISGLDKELKKKLLNNFSEMSMWSKECAEIEAILEFPKINLMTSCKSEWLLESKKILQSISELKHRPFFNIPNLDATIDEKFPNEIVPSYDSSTFVILNFTSLQLKGHPVFSPPLQASGLTWRLKVYPSGNENERGKYLSVLFELSSSFTERSKHQYKVEMIHQKSGDPSKAFVQEFVSDFHVGECWGFNHFYLLDRLLSEGFLNAQDTLLLKFSVRPVSYYQKSKIQEWYINQLNQNQ